jgi:hypothetical protein
MEPMRRTNLYLDPEKLRALKMIAASEDASVSDLVREAIDGMIAKRLAKVDTTAKSGSIARLPTTLLDDVLQGIDAARSAEITQDEIERDVADAVREARTERTARRRRSASTPTVGNG